MGIIAAIWSNGTSKKAVACTPTAHAPLPAAARLALAGYAGRIQQAIERSRDGTRDEWWEDPLTGSRRQIAFDGRGRIESVFGTIVHGQVEQTVWVLYPARNWTSDQHRLSFSLTHQRNAAAQIAQTNRDEVATGKATILGRKLIGGRPTLHLRKTIHFPPMPAPPGPLPRGLRFPAPPDIHVDTWVDPLTYLPVRTVSFEENRGAATVTDESWLPRTKANIAKTKVVIPHGFKHNVPQHGTGFGIGQYASISRCT